MKQSFYSILEKYKQYYPLNDLTEIIIYLTGKSLLELIRDDYILINSNDIEEIVQMRLNNYPLSYILGKQFFFNTNLLINDSCLIPRMDTESIIEYVLYSYQNEKKMKILDLCTGSGAIAIALAKEKNNWEIDGSDISSRALKIAHLNIKENDIHNLHLIKSNLFDNISKRYDLIISNPPYLSTLDSINYSVLYEPHIALFGGADGLDFFRKIISEASFFSKKIILEHSDWQADKIRTLLTEQDFHVVDLIFDLEKRRRATVAYYLR
jgi:release factor glutamine methyltransferase